MSGREPVHSRCLCCRFVPARQGEPLAVFQPQLEKTDGGGQYNCPLVRTWMLQLRKPLPGQIQRSNWHCFGFFSWHTTFIQMESVWACRELRNYALRGCLLHQIWPHLLGAAVRDVDDSADAAPAVRQQCCWQIRQNKTGPTHLFNPGFRNVTHPPKTNEWQ